MSKVNNPHNIARTSDFDIDQIKFDKLTTNDYSCRIIKVKYGDKGSRLVFQTPKMRSPFGVFESQMNEDDPVKYFLELSFDDEKSELVKKCHEKFAALDEKMMKECMKNPQWLGKDEVNYDLAEDKYIRMVRRFKNKETGAFTGEYPDTLRAKISVKREDGSPLVEVYDHNEERIPISSMKELMEFVPKGSRVKALLQGTNVWSNTSGYGLTWRVAQIKVFPEGNNNVYGFADESSEDEDESSE